MNEINSFTFFRDYYYLIDTLPLKDKKELAVAILDYMFKDIKPVLTGHNEAVFNTLSYQLNVSKNNALRSKGKGAPKGNQNAIKKQTGNNPETIQKTNRKQSGKQTGGVTENKQNSISIFLFLFSYFYISNLNNKDYIYSLFKEYLELRIKKKYVLNETVVKRLINKCNEYGKTDEEKIEIITNAINGAWKDFYPLKENRTIEYKPNWYGKELEEEKATDKEIEKLERVLNK